MKRNWKRYGRALAPVTLALGFAAVGCGDKDSDKKSDDVSTGPVEVDVGGGTVVKVSGEKVELTFPNAEAGSQYVIMPYSTGNLATTNGAGGNFQYTLAAGTGSGSGLLPLVKAHEVYAMTTVERQHAVRTLFNRFDSRAGLDQSPGFWELAEKLDSAAQNLGTGFGFTDGTGDQSLTAFFKRELQRRVQRRIQRQVATPYSFLTATAGDCPTSIYVPGKTEAVPASDSVDKQDFCVAYLSAPITDNDRSAIESRIATILKRYKEAIYKDDFSGAKDYPFKPIIAVYDGIENIAGAFSADVSTKQKQPVLFMLDNLSDIEAYQNQSEAQLKSLWYSTLAHEMQHAIVDFYRVRKAAAERETAILDEGMAHFMEDVFGYGEANHATYANGFLSTFINGSHPVLEVEEESGKDWARGGSNVLLYYLASQKGGVKYEAGELTGGDGLTFLVDAVKGAKNGPKNLAEKFGDDWTTTFGNFLGAVMLDGTTVKGIADKYTAQDPVANIKNVEGSDATFGMSFNSGGGVAEKFADPDTTSELKTNLDFEMPYYKTNPVLYKASGADAKVTVTTTADNAAISVIRIK